METVGSGEPIVLLHPLALSSRIWHDVANALARSFEVWLVDLRGHGRSGWDGEPFTLFDMAHDVLALLDERGAARASLVGMSMGGGVAMSAAALDPGRSRAIVLADTTSWYGPNAMADWAARAEKALVPDRRTLLPFQVERWFTDAFRAAQPQEVKRICDIFVATDGRAHAAACRAMGAFDARELVRQVTARALVLVGEEDYATPPSMARETAAAIHGAELRVLAGLRHLSLVERPALAADIAAHVGAA